jgi:hypothetical protein
MVRYGVRGRRNDGAELRTVVFVLVETAKEGCSTLVILRGLRPGRGYAARALSPQSAVLLSTLCWPYVFRYDNVKSLSWPTHVLLRHKAKKIHRKFRIRPHRLPRTSKPVKNCVTIFYSSKLYTTNIANIALSSWKETFVRSYHHGSRIFPLLGQTGKDVRSFKSFSEERCFFSSAVAPSTISARILSPVDSRTRQRDVVGLQTMTQNFMTHCIGFLTCPPCSIAFHVALRISHD